MLSRLAAAALFLAACGHDHTDETDPALADVIYEGTVNDEALEALLAATPVADSESAVTLSSPENDAAVPRATPVQLEWETPTGMREPADPHLARWLRHLGARSPSGALFGHGPPTNGRAYFVVLSTPDNDKLVRVFTALTSYTPSDEMWSRITGAGAPISVLITTGIYDNNLLAADGGPFVGDTVTFTVEP